METKIHIRVGHVELDCQGSEEFLKEQLPSILDAVTKLDQLAGKPEVPVPSPDPAQPANPPSISAKSTSTVAQKLGCGSGSELAFAAAVKLSLIDKHESFTRSQILTEMKAAKAFFKSSFSANLTNILATLTKAGKLNDVGKDTYSLPQEQNAEMVQKLA